jgi:hypothetical protein
METPTTQSVAPSNEPRSSQIPNLLKIGSIPTSTQMDVDTSVLEPVSHSQSTCRFVLENKGILHSHSKIVFSCLEGASALAGFFPINIGVYSLIKNCRLMSGGKTIIEQRDFNRLMAYESMFISNEHNVEKELYSTGRMMNHQFQYQTSTSGTKAQGMLIDTGIAIDRALGSQGAIPQVVSRLNEPQFSIALSDLFPFLKQQQLPLFMMKEQITIELEFEDNTNRMWFTGAGDPTIDINTAETKLIADYQFYPESMMTAFASQNNPLSLTYMVNRLSKQTIDAGTELKVRNIGGNGRIVPKIIASLQDETLGHDRNPLIVFSSVSPGGGGTSNGSIKLNVKYNNHLLYPIDVDNYAQHQHHLAQAQGMVPFVTRFEYCEEGGAVSIGDTPLENAPLKTTLNGKFCWQAHRLNRNERINSRGIEYEATYTTNGGARTQRIWLEMVRIATLSEGKFMITDA